jgi:hypothetical protein
MTTTFRDGNKCYTETWGTREMTSDEIAIVTDMVRGYDNVTVTGVHIREQDITVNFAVNCHSQAKYPNNHREYQEFRSLEAVEWKGWY